ncbi:type II secretion system F family protein [Nocardia veterana]|uniref:Type II secretion system F family protein n=1 Tax=Nocardia veterana TaxID=132249 RepID=A0A7X6LTU8_9NOCA|nr:type II secretion system F family protein [Nocardia veterana]NKY84390.1 type II secretion system F family protein [Nocardia veterana]
MSGISLALVVSAAALCVLPGRHTPSARLRAARGGRAQPLRVTEQRVGDPLAVASALDLLSACLRAGLPTATAARAVAPVAPEPFRSALSRAADLLALGADPVTAWERAAQEAPAPEMQSLARLVRRSARSGAALTGAVTELAGQCRSAVEDAAAARAERAGVLISGPLGLCFLPAFVCLGIVPVVAGLAGPVLGGGSW